MSQKQNQNSKKQSEHCSDDDERMSESSDEGGQGGLELEALDGKMVPYSDYEQLLRWQRLEAKMTQRLAEIKQKCHDAGRLYTQFFQVYSTSKPEVQKILSGALKQHAARVHALQLEKEQLQVKIHFQSHPHISSSSSSSTSFSHQSVLLSHPTSTMSPSVTMISSRSASPEEASTLHHSSSRNRLELSTASTRSETSSPHQDRRGSYSTISSPSSRTPSPTKPSGRSRTPSPTKKPSSRSPNKKSCRSRTPSPTKSK